MKHNKNDSQSRNLTIRALGLSMALAVLPLLSAWAHPYASGMSGTNGAGFVSFYMNETGATVTVTFNDSTTTNLGILPAGLTNFFLGSHAGYQISCYKQGNGQPSLITSDTFSNSIWSSPRGVGINKNAKIGSSFGRIYIGQSAASTGVNGKSIGIYALNPDQTRFTGPIGNTNFFPGGNGPWRIRVNDDGTVLVNDFTTAHAGLWQYTSDLSSFQPVLNYTGQVAAAAAFVHGDMFGTPKMVGSIAQSNLVLYTFDSGMATPYVQALPDATNCIRGPITFPGSFNCVFRYNIGAGPLPWNKRPDYSYTYGLDGIAELRTEGEIGQDGKLILAYGRANSSNPNLQILRPPITTNSAPYFTTNADFLNGAASDPTNWVYTGGVTPPFNLPPVGIDPWSGINGSGAINGTYAGVRVSPDGTYLAAVDINNGVTLANLTNGIPNDGTIYGFSQGAYGAVNGLNLANARGMDWDAADNIWVCSSGQALLRSFSLGLTTTCISSNDWTGTNGTFRLVVPPLQASVTVISNTASQNYVNNLVGAGTPIPGIFRINLGTNDTSLMGPTTVNFVRGGTPGIVGIINVTSGGSGYTNAPTVTIGGSGGATAFATVAPNGTNNNSVTSVTVLFPGSGYSAAPSVTFSGAAGSNATATSSLGLDLGQYSINTNETPNGVTVGNNSVTFPAGLFGGSNGPNWNVDVKVTPKVNPISGPTYAFNVRLTSGTNNSAASPLNGNIVILNTGPQLLQLAAPVPSTANGMNRGIPTDQARFTINRFGDTNGPGNSAVSVSANTLTITNVLYLARAGSGMAKNPLDYTAAAQNFTGSALSDSTLSSIVIPPGVASVNASIGNPVKHTNADIQASNLVVVISLTNTVAIGSPPSTTNVLSSEGSSYLVGTNALVLNEFDNAVGGETVIWSNPLTNAFDSTNWTLVYASIGQGNSPTLPFIRSNYDNTYNGGPNGDGQAYYANFGKSVHDPNNDGFVDVPPSATMIANGWSNALKITVNKDASQNFESGINLYPQIPGAPWTGNNFMVFQGNYALRFDMYLSLYDAGINNPLVGPVAREFAAFGINHYGTNCNWRLDINPRADGTGARPINADGQWCSIGAASGSITPADYDMFMSPPMINPIWGPINSGTNSFGTNDPGCITACNITYQANTNAQSILFTTNLFISAAFTNAYQSSPGVYTGVTNVFGNAGVQFDQNSTGNHDLSGTPAILSSPQVGVIKNPPFVGIDQGGGAPDNRWVDVSLEITRQTNLTFLVARQPIMNCSLTNGTANPPFGSVLAPLRGTPMLGYLDPNNLNFPDYSAFVYYSNLRVVEMSPYIPWTNQIYGLIVTNGQSFTLSCGATFASNPLTNTWYVGSTNGASLPGVLDNGTPTLALRVDTFAATNAVTNLTINNIQSPTNFMSVWSDKAGSVTSFVAAVEVVFGPTNTTAGAGSTVLLTATPTGNFPPSAFQWVTNGVNLTNSAHYAGVKSNVLSIINVQAGDSLTYTLLMTNGSVIGSVSTNGSVFGFSSATLTVTDTPPSGVTIIPAATNAVWGSPVALTATASGGTQPFTYYQWSRAGTNMSNGGNISGVTSSTLVLSSVSGADATNNYNVAVGNAFGTNLSGNAILTLRLTPPKFTNIVAKGQVVLKFTSTNGFDTTNAFILQSSPVVTGPYTNDPSVIFTNLGGGAFSVGLPQTADTNFFYRLQHAP